MRTLEDINAELEQVRQKLDRARKLSAVMEDLKAQHEERPRAAEDALTVLYREQEDVEELERLSFASFLARIRGGAGGTAGPRAEGGGGGQSPL